MRSSFNSLDFTRGVPLIIITVTLCAFSALSKELFSSDLNLNQYKNKSCSNDKQCLHSQTFLKCDPSKGVCRCQSKHHYEESVGKCLIRTETTCLKSWSNDNEHVPVQECVLHAECILHHPAGSEGVCICQKGERIKHDEFQNLCKKDPLKNAWPWSSSSPKTVMLPSFGLLIFLQWIVFPKP